MVGNLFAPSRREIAAVATRASLVNSNPDAKGWLLNKVKRPPSDWDSRAFLTVPGLVWTVDSDTCMTGRVEAPRNIAYDELGREFVFRQPIDEAELAAIMSADSNEIFACYRFDGLERWTKASVEAWLADRHVIAGWLSHRLTSETDSEMVEGLQAFHAYLTSDEFRTYFADFHRLVSSRPK